MSVAGSPSSGIGGGGGLTVNLNIEICTAFIIMIRQKSALAAAIANTMQCSSFLTKGESERNPAHVTVPVIIVWFVRQYWKIIYEI